MDHLGVRKAVVGGISLGAAVALRLAALHPERTCGLIIARPAWIDGPSLETMSPYVAVAQRIAESGSVEGLARFLHSEDLQKVQRVSPDNALSLQAFFSQANPESTVQLLSRIAKDAPAVGDLISTISVPALIIANDQEFVHPLEYALTIHSKLPLARLRIITSKTVDATAYRKEFAMSLREFLLSLEDRP
jgi:pimeloyl-ACP methyl ester carboxylesterase